MNRRLNLVAAWLSLTFSAACGSDDSSGGAERACVPGASVACTGSHRCNGVQVCDDSGDRYGSCICGSGVGGGSMSATIAGGGASVGSGKYQTATASSTTPASGGTASASGSAGSVGGTQAVGVGGSATSSSCAPKDMTGYSYPSYHSAKRVASACTDAQIEAYYSDCFTSGNCTAFKSGGASASCGACLLPTSLDSASYGPLLKLGDEVAYLSATNLAGCIELVGEPECAKKIQIAQLCEYYACASSCKITDEASYQAEIQCMTAARNGVCEAAEDAAVCITSSAHVAACSGASLKTQFVVTATVFCQ